MTADRSSEPGHVRPLVALGLATTAFIALLIFGLGMTSLVLDQDVIAVRGDEFSAITRRFGGIYRLALAFESAYSELHAEPTLTRALPSIERLVADLPPIDPTPAGARILTLPRRD